MFFNDKTFFYYIFNTFYLIKQIISPYKVADGDQKDSVAWRHDAASSAVSLVLSVVASIVYLLRVMAKKSFTALTDEAG